MKAMVMGTVCEGSRCFQKKDGTKVGTLRVYDGSDVAEVACDPKFIEGPEAVRVGASVRVMCYLRVWNNQPRWESCNGVEVVAGK